MSAPEPSSKHAYVGPLVCVVLFIAGFTALLLNSAEAREVTLDSVARLFAIATTPFILETTVAVILLVVVLTYNQWRLNKEGDEWVYMVTHEPEEGDPKQDDLPKAITQRLVGVVMKDKPTPLDEAQAIAGVIDGYLELGMPSQALDEMHRVSDLPDTVNTAILKFRVLGTNLATEPALSLLRDAADRFPGDRPQLVVAAVDLAKWLEKHMPSQVRAQTAWKNEAEAIARLTVRR